ncbi:MAG: type II toxin-antitoxin system MqsR family toxin [Bacteroidales bacterium]|nr:type II toxin-antitoxin system MqsR family toxin [Bacteroidales bacterium]
MMSDKEKVEKFLRLLKQKAKVWGILYLDDRSKNAQTLADLELKASERDRIIENLIIQDYSDGPLNEKHYDGMEMWVFGKEVKGKEIYIKITLGDFSDRPVCISFHISEYSLTYPFKK